MRKLMLFFVVLGISFSWFTYAISKFNYESALWMANEYITNSSFDENWKDHNPQIEWKWKEFHTDDDNKISYIEFKVSCDNNPDCWFIMVNFDWDDVTIPVASTSWNTPSEILLAQNGWDISDNKLYYFSPFDMYSENSKNNEVSSLDPVDNIDKTLEQDTKLTKEEKQEKRKLAKNNLRNKIKSMQKEAWDYKKTDDFKNKRQELRDKKQSIPKEEVSYKILPFGEFANAETNQWWNWYTSPWTSDKFITWNSASNCWSRIPCYNQYTTTYNWSSCYVWCTPVAFWMIYWYYDRLWGTYANLISWTANSINDTTVNTMIKAVWTKLSTYCSWNEWATNSTNYTSAINYAKDKWYNNSVAINYTWTPSSLFTTIKSEINSNRPIVIHLRSLDWTKGHSVVWYWYKTTGSLSIVRINMGWWYTLIPWTTSYYYSNVDYDISSMYYNGRAGNYANRLTTIKIQ